MAKQGTLLVVDDNRNILTSLQYLLEEYFQQVITLNSPVTIPSLLQREAIDVVLLDMNFSPASTAEMRDFTGCAKSNGCVRRFKWYCSLPTPTSI